MKSLKAQSLVVLLVSLLIASGCVTVAKTTVGTAVKGAKVGTKAAVSTTKTVVKVPAFSLWVLNLVAGWASPYKFWHRCENHQSIGTTRSLVSEDEPFFIEDFIEIPEVLTSFETGKPFAHCVDCGTQLLENGPPYLIQKAFKKSEVLIEYAQCLGCYEELTSSYSKQTMSDLWNFFLDSCNFEYRKKKLIKESPRKLEPWIENCLTCGKGKDEVSSYALLGQCDGPHLLFYYLPYIICDECQMRMHELMSSKSRDIWDRWYEDNIGAPPVMANDFTPGKVVLV